MQPWTKYAIRIMKERRERFVSDMLLPLEIIEANPELGQGEEVPAREEHIIRSMWHPIYYLDQNIEDMKELINVMLYRVILQDGCSIETDGYHLYHINGDERKRLNLGECDVWGAVFV